MSHKHPDRFTQIKQFGHKHAHEHITRCWFIYWRAYENPYIGYLISKLIGSRKLSSLVISMPVMFGHKHENMDKHAERYTKIMQFGHKHAQLCSLVTSMLREK